MCQRLPEQPVGEPGVPRQEWTVEVGPYDPAQATAFEAALAVVAEAGDDTPEWIRAWIEPGSTDMVLEAGKRAFDPGLELALEQHVADHASFPRDRVEREQSDAGQLGPVEVSIRAPQQLVTAAHREHRGSIGHRPTNVFRLRGQIVRDKGLFAILAASHVQQIVLIRPQRIAERDSTDIQLVAPPRCAPGEDRNVAAVGIDVEVVGIQMPDDDLHAARSQYGRTKPRSPTTFRSASIAVYVGRTTSSPPAGVSSSPRSSPASSEGTTSIRSGSRPPYLKRSASSAARSPVATNRSRPARIGSKSTSQIQETSRPSAIASFNPITTTEGVPPSTIVRTASFAPAGFLISSIRRLRSPTAIRSKRPRARCTRCIDQASADARAALPRAWRA